VLSKIHSRSEHQQRGEEEDEKSNREAEVAGCEGEDLLAAVGAGEESWQADLAEGLELSRQRAYFTVVERKETFRAGTIRSKVVAKSAGITHCIAIKPRTGAAERVNRRAKHADVLALYSAVARRIDQSLLLHLSNSAGNVNRRCVYQG